MIHFNLRKGILTCGYFILFIASGIHVSAACTNTNNNLNEVAQPFLTGTSPYESHTQGMCIAENYIVWTRTSDSDSSETTYVILDLKSKEEKGHYDDGSVQDWYYLISYSVEGGHPGMIIEHAYMDNPHDNAILKDEAQLKAMGTADADAIASYYNLQIKTKTEN